MDKFSQNIEDIVVADYFGDHIGPFLDLGANDGKTLSNTHALALRGWSGVCVEPSPIPHAKLCGLYLHRDDIYCFKYAISIFNAKVKFQDSGTHLNGDDTGLLSSLHIEETTKWRPSTVFEEIDIDMVCFKTLMEQSPYKTFDFISIDCEGEDLNILRQMNLTELGCRCLCIEHNGKADYLTNIVSICVDFGLKKTLLYNAENIIMAL